MRPNTLMHIFFDGVNVDSHCAPGLIPTPSASNTATNNVRPVTTAVPLYISGTTTPLDTSKTSSIPINGVWGTPIYSDANGHVAGQFNIPGATFKTGDRILQICDVSNLAQGNAAITTISSATFTASNLNVTRQATTLTTVNPVVSIVPVTNTVITSCTSISNSTVFTGYPQYPQQNYGNPQQHNNAMDPIAQSFTITTPDGSAGIFATGIDLFFEQSSLISNTTDNGVTVYICEMNNGYPDTSTILPFSTTHLYHSQINPSSSNSQVATPFVFESPVFLNNNTEYAFVVKPDNSDPDYRVYTAVLGNVDLASGAQVYSQPVTGTAFYGATATEWTALQTEYIKFTLYSAIFSSGSADAYFNNANSEFINIYNIAYANTTYSLFTGDYVFQSTNSSPSTAQTGTFGTLSFYDTNYQRLYVDNSTGGFATSNGFVQIHRFANSSVAGTPNTSTLIATANTYGLVNLLTDAIVGQFSSIVPAGTGLTFDYKGVSNANTPIPDSVVTPIVAGYETEFHDYSRVVLSKTYENSLLSGSKSMTVHAAMTTDSPYISPAIDMVRNQELVINNIINPVTTLYNEFYNNGQSQTKYISQVITLAQGQDAEDLQVILSAYRPPNSDIKVYVKFLNGEDSDSITQKTWTLLNNQNPNFYSSPGSINFNDFTFTVPATTPSYPTTGNISVTGTAVTGTANNFSSTLNLGWWITVAANTTTYEVPKQIISINSNNSITLSGAFTTNYANTPFLLVAPPTTAYISANTLLQVPGTVTVSTTNNAIIGSGTNFTGLNLGFMPGSIISVAGDEQVIVSVANSTYLTVGTPWATSATGANAYIQTNSGLTYQNSRNNLFTTYLSFQIKVVLQSNDSANVPILSNLRAIALQL